MTLAELIKKYRQERGMSMREFGRKCGFSNAYISTLESGVNPHTGEILKPTLATYQKIAAAMGITIDSLFSMLQDGALVTLPPQKNTNDGIEELREKLRANPELRTLLSASSKLTAEDLRKVIDIVRAINRE